MDEMIYSEAHNKLEEEAEAVDFQSVQSAKIFPKTDAVLRQNGFNKIGIAIVEDAVITWM